MQYKGSKHIKKTIQYNLTTCRILTNYFNKIYFENNTGIKTKKAGNFLRDKIHTHICTFSYINDVIRGTVGPKVECRILNKQEHLNNASLNSNTKTSAKLAGCSEVTTF